MLFGDKFSYAKCVGASRTFFGEVDYDCIIRNCREEISATQIELDAMDNIEKTICTPDGLKKYTSTPEFKKWISKINELGENIATEKYFWCVCRLGKH